MESYEGSLVGIWLDEVPHQVPSICESHNDKTRDQYVYLVTESKDMSSGISNELENQIMQVSNLYGMGSEIKINRKITKTGSVGQRGP